MKRTIILTFVTILIISFAFYSCTNDDPGNIQYGEVEFGFNLKEISTNKSIQSDFGDPSTIVLSIEDASGTLVYDTEEVELYNMNGAFVSKPLSLLVGDYKLVTFMVIDADANVIYASPLAGSNMAYLVNNPVPINFTVNKDQTIKLIPEVLSTEDVTPEDFGYTTFGFDVIETFDFLISVFAYNETSENFELTEAILSVYADDNPIFRDSLLAMTNQVKVNDGFDSYVIEIIKDGFETYNDTLTNAELKLHFNSEENGPLIVLLSDIKENKIVLTTDVTAPHQFNLHLGWNSGSEVIINWGDNNVETVNISASSSRYIKHDYTTSGIYTIELTGDIENVRQIGTSAQPVTSVDLTDASGLEELQLSQSPLNNIDLSNNPLLYRLDVYMNNLTELDITNNPNLRFVTCFENSLTNLDLSNNDILELLYIQKNSITELDVTNCTVLETLNFDYNDISAIDLSNNNNLINLSCTENLSLTNLDITNNINLVSLHYSYNPQLRYVDISNNLSLTSIGCVRNTMSSEEVNSLLIDLLTNVQRNPRSGEINTIINSAPSGAGLAAKNTLVGTYNWNVVTD